ncbi:MAG: PDZ domain-containing protein, partial [Acidobacteria bacterium]|nr:PDZ domain-containing protein [Acidobacteriota bacterium]
YTGADFERVTTEVAGHDMKDFFRRYVRGAEVLPYDEALGYLGLKLVREPAPYTAGITLDEETTQGVRVRSVRNDSAAEAAGLQTDDMILTLGGTVVRPEDWTVMLNQHKRGERIPVTLRRDRQTIQTTITLADPERYTYRIEERSDATPEMRALRAAWVKGI